MKGSDWHTVPDIKKWAINIVDFACPQLYYQLPLSGPPLVQVIQAILFLSFFR